MTYGLLTAEPRHIGIEHQYAAPRMNKQEALKAFASYGVRLG